MNYAYLSEIKINHKSQQPLYIQLREALRELIINGSIQAGSKLPSSRALSDYLNIHRQTVISALDELIAEGWLLSKERKGVFVNDKLGEVNQRSNANKIKRYPEKAGFEYKHFYHPHFRKKICLFGFDDGSPDIRIAPYKAFGKAYTQTLAERGRKNILTTVTGGMGSLLLRAELAQIMSTYRGMGITTDNILITHGSQMSIFLVASKILSKGDKVIVTKPSYLTANSCFEALQAQLLYVPVDKDGMDIDAVATLCKKNKIKCLFVTSHHHHPTTVTLTVERRLKLLQLAEKFGFAIIEDDYDYDFHYENKPLPPIAANDKSGNVIYIGSFSKILSHSFRVGYIIAPRDFIAELAMFRRLVDRRGDDVLEDSFGKMLKNNTISNHIRKALLIYKERRNNTYELLKTELNNYINVDLPAGGLAFWAHLDKKISLEVLSKQCMSRGMTFPDGSNYNYDKSKMNACRMGFASMNTKELTNAISILKDVIKKHF